jgi:hypothetical protein
VKKNSLGTSTKTYGKGPVRYSFLQGAEGALHVGVDFSFAPVPGAYYYANALSVRHDRELAVVVISFGRFDAAAGKLRDRLDVVMPEAALFFQFWNSSRDVEKSLDEQLRVLGLSAADRSVNPKSLVRTTLFANTIFVTTGGGESCLDFYYLPIRDIHLAKAAGVSKKNHPEIGLDPIIRILCSPAILKALFDACRPHAGGDLLQTTTTERADRANAS